ncbi:MAG: mannonate dehydratase [Thermomicrobiales bacterium]
MHPDDLISPVRSVGRILTSPDNLQQVIDLVPSPNNGITFCGVDLDHGGRHAKRSAFAGQNKVFFIHFRDVDGNPAKFRETFHDAGQTDMFETMHTWRDCRSGPFRVDHIPTLAGEANLSPGYDVMGRLYAARLPKSLMKGSTDRLISPPTRIVQFRRSPEGGRRNGVSAVSCFRAFGAISFCPVRARECLMSTTQDRGLSRSVRECLASAQGTMGDVTPEQAHWQPLGRVVPIAGHYIHHLTAEDAIINFGLRVSPLF